MLIILFHKETFKISYSPQFIPGEVLIVQGERYKLDKQCKENNAFIGFFDWLRFDAAVVAGLRMCFFEHHGYNDMLRQFHYIRPAYDNKCMELLFGTQDYKPELSGDQDFTNNYVYFNDAGSCLITFGTENLSIDELKSLQTYYSEIDIRETDH